MAVASVYNHSSNALARQTDRKEIQDLRKAFFTNRW